MEELYESHDKKAAQIRAVTPVSSELSEGEGMTTDGEDSTVPSKRQMIVEAQERAS